MSDIIIEAEEDLRQERLHKFWKENGPYIILFVVATIIGTGIVSGYKAWDTATRSTQTNDVFALTTDEAFPENFVSETPDLRPGLDAITTITAAGTFLKEGKTERALELYKKAAADTSLPSDWQQLALLMSARLENPEDVSSLLAPVFSDGKSPWRYHARLDAAAIEAHNGNHEKAREHLNAVRDAGDVPAQIVERAEMLDRMYAVQQQNTTPSPDPE